MSAVSEVKPAGIEVSKNKDSLLKFPCEFTFKIVGKKNLEFEAAIVKIMQQHFPDLSEGAFKLTPSRGDNYLSFSVTVKAVSQAQLDAAYLDLKASRLVLFAL